VEGDGSYIRVFMGGGVTYGFCMGGGVTYGFCMDGGVTYRVLWLD
jgi:hypothetical protein